MKYQIDNTSKIPHEKRKDINDKILYLIDNRLVEDAGITKENIFNSYTGDGGLHGLNFNDYESYHDYSEAKKEIENGQFFTPYAVSKFIIDCLKPSKHDIIMDLTCGHGSFINFVESEHNFYGCEIDVKSYKIAKYLYPNANLHCGDIRTYEPNLQADIVVGNPPFNLKWNVGGTNYWSQLYYTIKAAKILKAGGIMAIVVPSSFLADDFSDKGMIESVESNFNLLCQFDISKDTFKDLGVANFKTKIMFFQKKSEHIENTKFSSEKIVVNDINDTSSNIIHNNFVKPAVDLKNKLKSKLYLESIHDNEKEETKAFNYKVRKMLYDIKRNPKTNDDYARCENYVERFYTQKRPEGMSYEDWEKKKITKNKVLSYLKQAIKKQNKVEVDKIKLVKTNGSLVVKGYSSKTRKIAKEVDYNEEEINYMVQNNIYPFEDKSYKKLIDKKRKEFSLQNKDFATMKADKKIKEYLDNFSLYNHREEREYKLTDIQKEDTNKFLQKRYGLLQWEQGSGKTISGLTQAMYRLENNNVKNVFVLSTAIAINNNWQPTLEDFKVDYVRINKLSDIEKIKDKQIVLITMKMLTKYEKQIKRFVRKKNQKLMLVFDESDAITNQNSIGTKATLNCFRRLDYKVLMTGTSTRNNICEIYSQLELLFNNSINMLSECDYIYERSKNKQDKDLLVENVNSMYLRPFPAYKRGYALFSQSHLPDKITVFGISQKTQDVYNADVLQKLLARTIITRKFEEIKGKQIHEVKQEICHFNDSEREVYRMAVEELYKMDYNFKKTGNSRKDGMLKILNQLILMLNICAAPHTFKEYNSKELPSKFKKVAEMIGEWDNERVAIGVRHVKNAHAYADMIREKFPDRPLFVVTGTNYSFKKRKELETKIAETKNGIIVCTQQSLSCSVNMDSVNKCIIPELHWNNAGMSQFYFRFIRFTSDTWKQVYFVTYANSIESNVLKMVVAKEKLNLFVKDEYLDDTMMLEKFGIDFDISKMLMTKETDSEGKVNIKWGKQNISQ